MSHFRGWRSSTFPSCWSGWSAIGVGQRFLERPGPARAAALGLAVGVSQLFKYNGFTSGVIVAASAAVWMVVPAQKLGSPRRWPAPGDGASSRRPSRPVCYWPWFQFVEAHGGYRALLAHHRGYLGGIGSWPGHLALAARAGPDAFGRAGLAGLRRAGGRSCAMLVSVGEFNVRRVFTLRGFLLAASCSVRVRVADARSRCGGTSRCGSRSRWAPG